MKNSLVTVFLILSLNCFSQAVEWVESFDGAKIAYTQSGNGDLTLVFVHGWCCNKEFWKFQVPYFSKKYNVVTIDLSGYGESEPRTEHSFDNWGDDILSVISIIKPTKYILIGHSAGAYIVLNAANKSDERMLAIVGADGYSKTIGNTYEQDYIRQFEEDNRALSDQEFKEKMRDSDRWFVPNSDKSNIDWIKDEMSNCQRETCAQALREALLYLNRITEEFKKFDKPVFAINRSSKEINMDFFQSNQIDLRPYYMEDVGHFIMMDKPIEFNELIDKIIEQVDQ